MPEAPRVPSSAQHYAQALVALAREAGDYAPWRHRLARLVAILGDLELARALANPGYTVAERQQLVAAVLAKSPAVDNEARNLALLLVGSGRESLLPAIQVAYLAQVDRAEGRVRAELTTAIAMPPAELGRLQGALAQRLQRSVVFEHTVDPQIIGGMVLRIGDRIFDGSLASRLRRLRQRMVSEAPTG
ncbi:MAG TPA: ATP synthase F1 subunit delta [Verrucomicrobiae bacterium]|nr:ATP synthase F1 subunit delta [Verrucomicrobiae bacterium]